MKSFAEAPVGYIGYVEWANKNNINPMSLAEWERQQEQDDMESLGTFELPDGSDWLSSPDNPYYTGNKKNGQEYSYITNYNFRRICRAYSNELKDVGIHEIYSLIFSENLNQI